jgi:hypothetical protein
MANSESLFQQTFVSLIRKLYPDFVMNLSLNGISLDGLSVTQRSKLIAQAKREGMENGVMDIAIYLPDGVVLNLESKRPKGGAQSPDQVVVQSKLAVLGHNYYLVRTPEQVFELIAKHTELTYRQFAFKQLDQSIINQFGESTIKDYYHI